MSTRSHQPKTTPHKKKARRSDNPGRQQAKAQLNDETDAPTQQHNKPTTTQATHQRANQPTKPTETATPKTAARQNQQQKATQHDATTPKQHDDAPTQQAEKTTTANTNPTTTTTPNQEPTTHDPNKTDATDNATNNQRQPHQATATTQQGNNANEDEKQTQQTPPHTKAKTTNPDARGTQCVADERKNRRRPRTRATRCLLRLPEVSGCGDEPLFISCAVRRIMGDPCGVTKPSTARCRNFRQLRLAITLVPTKKATSDCQRRFSRLLCVMCVV